MKEDFIKVNGYNIRFLENGAKKSRHILLLHGLGASAERWSKVMPILSKHFHVVAPDLIGFGYSDKPLVSYAIPFFVDFVKSFADVFGIKSLNLIGGSLGGHIAAEFAIQNNDVVEKLVLGTPAGIMKETTPTLTKYVAAAMYPTYDNAKDAFKEMVGSKGLDETYTLDFVKRMRLPNSKYAFLSSLMGIKAAPNLENRLYQIKAPTLVVWGEKDTLIPLDFAEQFHKGIKGSRLVIMNDCGHTPYFEEPDKFCDLVLEFLNK